VEPELEKQTQCQSKKNDIEEEEEILFCVAANEW
jgi:hypothetical protein